MNDQPIDILIKLPEVCRQVGLGKSAIYEMIATEAFPAPIKLGRYSRWSQVEIQGWVALQKDRRLGRTNAQAERDSSARAA